MRGGAGSKRGKGGEVGGEARNESALNIRSFYDKRRQDVTSLEAATLCVSGLSVWGANNWHLGNMPNCVK